MKRANYADYLAAQIRLSYPTVAQMVKSKELRFRPRRLTRVRSSRKIGQVRNQRARCRTISRQQLEVPAAVVSQVTYQRVPDRKRSGNDGPLKARRAAFHVARYPKRHLFSFSTDLGGFRPAALTYDKSLQSTMP